MTKFIRQIAASWWEPKPFISNSHWPEANAVPTNSSTLTAFLFHVTNLWRRTLRQRSQKDWTTWERIKRLADDWLPKPRHLMRIAWSDLNNLQNGQSVARRD